MLAGERGDSAGGSPLGSGAFRTGLLSGFAQLPPIRALVKAMESSTAPEKATATSTSCSWKVSAKQATKIAGLPQAGEVYLVLSPAAR